jgi:GT2 family glycosyltransferase
MLTSKPPGQFSGGASSVIVSVIIVSWNAREYLTQCLATLTTGACRYPMEIIVVDNASSDGSADVVASMYPSVRIIRNSKNLGFAKANNIGISTSSGKYICLINSDVEVLTGCITQLVDYCDAHAETGMAGPRIIGSDGKLQRSCRGFPSLWNMLCRALALDSLFPRFKLFTGYLLRHWPQDCLRRVDILTGCFWVVRREALNEVGLLDEIFFMYGEDMDWCKRFRDKGWAVAFVPSAEAIHYGGASSSNAPVRFYIERHRADLQYWRKHHSRASGVCYFGISCLHLLVRGIGYSLAFLLHSQGRSGYRYKAARSFGCLKWMCWGGIKQWPWMLESALSTA